MKYAKELRFLFPAIKAMFVNRKVRNFVAKCFLVAVTIGLLGSMVLESAIYSAAAKVAEAYTGSTFQ